MDNTDNNVVVKYSSYTDAQKRATQKYRNNNRDKVNEQRKKYYKDRKESDPNFLEYKRLKAKEYYLRKKAKVDFIDEPEVPVVEMVVEPQPVVEEVVPEVKQDKPKRQRKAKKVEVVPEVIPVVIPEPVVEAVPVDEVKTKSKAKTPRKSKQQIRHDI
jgi:hypothetical protein